VSNLLLQQWLCNLYDVCAVFQIEHIKRANNLWTNDSLFLRDSLLIPVPFDSTSDQLCVASAVISHQQLPHVTSGFSKVPASPHRYRETVWQCQKTDVSAAVALMANAEDDVNQVDIGEYFSKYDTLLAKLKTDASKLDSSSW